VNTFHVDCELDYEVREQSLFVFNLGAASTPDQRVIAETVAVTPDLPVDEFHDESGRNRFHRVDVPPGHFSMRYLATVEVQPPEIDSLAPELPLAQLPGETLSYLRSSRYCEVEAIYGFAVRRFGNIPGGYQWLPPQRPETCWRICKPRRPEWSCRTTIPQVAVRSLKAIVRRQSGGDLSTVSPRFDSSNLLAKMVS
jgi:hypothetical protein